MSTRTSLSFSSFSSSFSLDSPSTLPSSPSISVPQLSFSSFTLLPPFLSSSTPTTLSLPSVPPTFDINLQRLESHTLNTDASAKKRKHNESSSPTECEQTLRQQLQQLESEKKKVESERKKLEDENFRLLKAQERSDEQKLCSVCLSNQIDTVLVVCGHSFCSQCVTRFRKTCPHCRKSFVRSVKIFNLE